MAQPAAKPAPAPAAAAAKPASPATPAAAAKPTAAKPAAAPAKPVGPPGLLRLKKGDMLFREGEMSRALFVLNRGMIRLFIKKGDANIELDTIRNGQVLGELAFLDGNPRSASAEALTDCELTEINSAQFLEVLKRCPEWLKMLLKAVVGRLRTANTRVKQLESASQAYDYNSDGKRAAHYIYISPTDALKLATTVLVTACRATTKTPEGVELRVGLLGRYANQIMGVPTAKLESFLEILREADMVFDKEEKPYLRSIDDLEACITYMNEENLLEPKKRHDISIKAFIVMSLIAKNLGRYKKEERTGMTAVNVGEIRNLEKDPKGGDLFRVEDVGELAEKGYCTNVNIKDAANAFTHVKAEEFLKAFKLQRLVMSIAACNEQKRKGGKKN